MSSVKPNAPNTIIKNNAQSNFAHEERQEQGTSEEHNYQEPNLKQTAPSDGQQCRFLPRLQGVENAAFQNQEGGQQKLTGEPTESEVYFADVSSCCNISVRNDGQDSSLYDEALDTQKPRLMSLQCVHKQQRSNDSDVAAGNKILQNFQEANISSSTVTEDEDYLVSVMYLFRLARFDYFEMHSCNKRFLFYPRFTKSENAK